MGLFGTLTYLCERYLILVLCLIHRCIVHNVANLVKHFLSDTVPTTLSTELKNILHKNTDHNITDISKHCLKCQLHCVYTLSISFL